MFEKMPAQGLEGLVEGKRVVIGGSGYVAANSNEGDPRSFRSDVKPGQMVVAVAIDGIVAGIIVMADQVRTDASAAIARFREAGISKNHSCNGGSSRRCIRHQRWTGN